MGRGDLLSTRVCIARVGGGQIKIEGWIIAVSPILILVLVFSMFPYYFRSLSTTQYWLMGGAVFSGLVGTMLVRAAFVLFAAHILGLEAPVYELYPFGGILCRNEKTLNFRGELLLGLIGPLVSMVFAGVFFLLNVAGRELAWSVPTLGIFVFLCCWNLLLAILSLIPVYPFDGGRIFGAALAALTGRARIFSILGSMAGNVFSLFLILASITLLFRGVIAGAVWWILVGISVFCVTERELLGYRLAQRISDFSVGSFAVGCGRVSSGLNVGELVSRWPPGSDQFFIVSDRDSSQIAVLSLAQLRLIPRKHWGTVKAGQLARPVWEWCPIPGSSGLVDALHLLQRQNRSSSLISDDNGNVLGMVTIKDLILGIQKGCC